MGTASPDSPWYWVRDMPPPFNVHVRLHIVGRMFIGVRGKDRQGRVVWAEYRRHELIPLVNLEFDYAHWQPLYPDKWQAQLPEPVTSSETGRMYYERSRYQAVDNATDEELAREMEGNRQLARDVPHSSASFQTDSGVEWWWNGYNVAYETPPNISLKHCEGRLLRAVAWSGARAAPNMMKMRTAGPALGALAALVGGSAGGADPVARFMPMDADHKDFDTAMAWFVALNPVERRPIGVPIGALNEEQKIIALRASAFPMSFAEIGAQFSGMRRTRVGRDGARAVARKDWRTRTALDGETIRKKYLQAIDTCCLYANGTELQMQLERQLEQLRERNRRYRSRA